MRLVLPQWWQGGVGSVSGSAHLTQYGSRTLLVVWHFGQAISLGHLLLFQVGLDLARREVAVVDVLGQVDPDQLVEPALLGRDGAVVVAELRLELLGGVEALGRLAGGQVIQRPGQGEQVAARLRLADDLLRRGVALGVDARLGLPSAPWRSGPGRGRCRSRSS